ncbi:MAG: ATP-dependent Clp protease adapter ClpS [Oligoflexales bacterium]|nr:ATP-dependent Clp protease adapter ClpS [Oligoflexales bacterium]
MANIFNGFFLSADRPEENEELGVVTKKITAVKKPSMYKVLLLNDDFTPMDFVVFILESIFQKDHATATRIMLSVHHEGKGICGVYTREIAETKVNIVNREARKNGYPLKATMEKA